MTNESKEISDSNAAEALCGYLTRVDMQMSRAGMARVDRDATCQQIVEQFYDLLGGPANKATSEQVDAAIGKLSNDQVFASDEIQSRGQMMRMYWQRMRIETHIPLAINDHGCKKIMWGELIKRTVCLYFFVLLASIVFISIAAGKVTLGFPLFFAMIVIIMPLPILLNISRRPVESLARAEDWPTDRLAQYRFAFLVLMCWSSLIGFTFIIGIYGLIAAAGFWPVDKYLFAIVLITLGWLSLLLAYSDMWRKRKRRLKLKRWATGN